MIDRYLFAATAILSIVVNTGATRCEESSTQDVQGLYTWCRDPPASAGSMFCLGYVAGVGQQMIINGFALRAMRLREDKSTLAFQAICGTSFISNGAMQQAFINWAERHPEKWSENAQMGVTEAMRETWPCRF
jgi:hypothetical protein